MIKERIVEYQKAFIDFFSSTLIQNQIYWVVNEVERLPEGGQLIFLGNGGSLAVSLHLAEDYLAVGKIPTRSISSTPLLSCLSNDFGYSNALVEWLKVVSNPEKDILFCISSSGNSQNLVNAAEWFHERAQRVYTLTGFDEDSPLSKVGFNIYLPYYNYGICEIYSELFLHIVLDEIVERKKGKI